MNNRVKNLILINPISIWLKWIFRTSMAYYKNKGANILIEYGANLIDSKLGKNTRFCSNSVVYKSEIGRMSYVGAGTSVSNTKIGNYVCVGPDVLIGVGRHPVSDFPSMHPCFYSTELRANKTFVEKNLFKEFKETTIGHDVWIGAKVIILDGVRIGSGSIIAAGSVVVGHVGDYEVFGGVPARKIKDRFPKEVVEDLLASEWFLLNDDDAINEISKINIKYFKSNNDS